MSASDAMILGVLVFLAMGTMATMFITKSMLLGYPTLIWWALLGGHAYDISAATWDIYYFIFWSSMGMAIFSSLVMYGLRTKKEEEAEGDQFIDEGGNEDVRHIDEGRSTEVRVGDRSERVRERAEKRRTSVRTGR